MPEFKDLIKDLYTTKGRELTEEKLNYIEKEYGGGKEEEFIKDFYATIGEDLTKDKFDYIRTEYLKKKEPTGGLLMQKTSANAPQFFGTPSSITPPSQLGGEKPIGKLESTPKIIKEEKPVIPKGKKPSFEIPAMPSETKVPEVVSEIGTQKIMTGDEYGKRNAFKGELTENISQTINNPKNKDLYFRKDGSLNIDNLSNLVAGVNEKSAKENNYDFSLYEQQQIIGDIANAHKNKQASINAAALTDLKIKQTYGASISDWQDLKDESGKVIKQGIGSKINNDVAKYSAEESNKVKQIAQTEKQLITSEVKPEMSKFKSDIELASNEIKTQYESEFNEIANSELNNLYAKYNELVNAGQLTEEQANAQLQEEFGNIQSEINAQLSEKYKPAFDNLNNEIKQKTDEIQNRINSRYQTKVTAAIEESKRRINSKVDELKKKYNLPDKLVKDYQKAFEENYAQQIGEKNKELLNQFRNKPLSQKLELAIKAGINDVISSIGGAMGYVGYENAAYNLNNFALDFTQKNDLPNIQIDDASFLSDSDWWILNGVRSLPFTLATMPINIGGGVLAGTMSKLLGATKKAASIYGVVGGGTTGWLFERFLEQGNSFNESLQSGKTEKEASKIAADVGNYNLATLPLNIVAMLPVFGKGFKFLEKAGVKSATEGATGYLEEVTQGWASQKAKLKAEGKDISFGDYFFSNQALQEGTVGAVTAQAFTLASLGQTNNEEKKINQILNNISVGGVNQTLTQLEILHNNKAITDEEYNDAVNLVNYSQNAIVSASNMNIDEDKQLAIIPKLTEIEKLKNMAVGEDLASQAARELIAEKEKEIKEIIKGVSPLYMVKQKGKDVPIAVEASQIEDLLKSKAADLFDFIIINDDDMQSRVDDVKNKLEKELAKEGKEGELAPPPQTKEGYGETRNKPEGQEDRGVDGAVEVSPSMGVPAEEGVTEAGVPTEEVEAVEQPVSPQEGKPTELNKEEGSVRGDVVFEGKRGQADSITFDGKKIAKGEEIELNNVNISQDDSMPDLRSGKYKVRMLSVDANGKSATLTLTDGNEVITTTVKDLRKAEQAPPTAEVGQVVQEDVQVAPTISQETEQPTPPTQVKGELSEGDKANLEQIAKEVGKNFREVQNVYSKYGEGKPLSEITVEDYRKAQEKRGGEKVDDEAIGKKAGISPKNLKDLYNINRELFGLNRIQAFASAIAMDRMIGAMAKRAGVTKAEMYGRLKFEKTTEQDLPESVLRQEKEEILRVYHGTSKDKDFRKFKDKGKGIFVTISPKEASEYAEQNDSMKFGDYDPITGSFKEINTSSRVIPMNLKLGNVYKLTQEDLKFLNSKPNYSALQKQLHAQIKAKGFDTIDYGKGVYAVLTEGRLKSMITNEVLFQKGLPQGVLFQVDAWHGSPYQFDKFELSKIGTGEGAQAFGWGLYFTDIESIAKNYADKLTETQVLVDGKPISAKENFSLYKAAYDIANLGYDKALERNIELRNSNYWGSDEAGIKTSEEIVKYIDELLGKNISFGKDRSLYKVSLHKGKTPEQYNWLEWDKPLSNEQKEKIKSNFLKEYKGEIVEIKVGENKGKFISQPFAGTDVDSTSQIHDTRKEAEERIIRQREFALKFLKLDGNAKDLYQSLSKQLKSDKSASEYLLSFGIDGIKYPAESIARGATSDTARGFNYVVFDENAVSIEEVIKFQKDALKARGAMMITLDGQAVVYALTDPNVSTPLHELAHVFEHYLTEGERTVVIKNAGTDGWTTETSEYFARGFERYLAGGKSPISALNKVFEKFKEWLTEIYNGIKGSDIDITLNTEMKRIYDAMLGKEKITIKNTELIKKQLAAFAKGLKQGIREGKINLKEYKAKIDSFNQTLKDALKDSGLSPQWQAKMIKYFGKIKTINNLNDALLDIDKLMESEEFAEAAERIKKAYKKLRKINKDRLTIADKNLISSIPQIKPRYLQDPLAWAEMLENIEKGLKQGGRRPDYKTISEMILAESQFAYDKEMAELKERTDEEWVNLSSDYEVLKTLGKLPPFVETKAQFEQYLRGVKTDEQLAKELEKQEAKEAKMSRTEELINEATWAFELDIKNNPEVLESMSARERGYYDILAKADLSKLSDVQLARLLNAFTNIKEFGDWAGVGDIAMLLSAKQAIEKINIPKLEGISPDKKAFNVFLRNLYRGSQTLAAELRSALTTNWDMVVNRLKIKHDDVLIDLGKILKKNKLKEKDRISIQIYGFMNDLIPNLDKLEQQKALLEDLITSVQNHYNRYNYESIGDGKIRAEAERNKAILEAQIMKENGLIQEYQVSPNGLKIFPKKEPNFDFQLNPKQKELYDFGIKKYADLKVGVEDYFKYQLNKQMQPTDGYLARIFYNFENNESKEPLKMESYDDANRFISKKPSGRAKERVGGIKEGGGFYELDFVEAFSRGHFDNLILAEAGDAYAYMVSVVNNTQKEIKEKFKNKDTIDNLIGPDGYVQSLIKNDKNYGAVGKDYRNFLKKSQEYLLTNYVSAMLKRADQVLLQPIPAFINAITIHPKETIQAIKLLTTQNREDIDEFSGYFTAYKRALGGQKELEKRVLSLGKNEYLEKLKTFNEKIQQLFGSEFMGYLDNLVSISTSVAGYIAHQKKIGKIKKASDFDIKEALKDINLVSLAYGEQFAANINNESNPANQAKVLKEEGAKLQWFLMSFSMNAFENYAVSIRNIFTKEVDSETRDMNAKIAFGYLSQAITYRVLKAIISSLIYGRIADWFLDGIGDDDDEVFTQEVMATLGVNFGVDDLFLANKNIATRFATKFAVYILWKLYVNENIKKLESDTNLTKEQKDELKETSVLYNKNFNPISHPEAEAGVATAVASKFADMAEGGLKYYNLDSSQRAINPYWKQQVIQTGLEFAGQGTLNATTKKVISAQKKEFKKINELYKKYESMDIKGIQDLVRTDWKPYTNEERKEFAQSSFDWETPLDENGLQNYLFYALTKDQIPKYFKTKDSLTTILNTKGIEIPDYVKSVVERNLMLKGVPEDDMDEAIMEYFKKDENKKKTMQTMSFYKFLADSEERKKMKKIKPTQVVK